MLLSQLSLTRSRILCLVSGALLTGGTACVVLDAGPSPVNAATAVPGLPVAGRAPEGEWVPYPAARPMDGVPVENFGVVNPGRLYRSAQPGKGDFEWLAEQGFRSVISLRKEHDDGEEQLKKLGLNYLYLPVPDYRVPTDEQAHTFLVFMRDSRNWPALVHCAGGQGRAGIMAALARYSIDGWDLGDALREAKAYRPFNFRIFGEQRRFLNRWKDRLPPGSYHPSRPLPAWPPTATATQPTGRS
jgi:protein tyrosine phosphatase (PTP) superfamily phosphohydrolase (DUF442 family)